MNVGVAERGEFHAVPAVAWIASFTLCTLADAMLGRWVLLPLFVAGFYGGTIIIAFVTYPMLPFWRTWLRRRGLIAWYLIEVGGALFVGSVVAGTWAVAKMGWARLLLAGALFPPGAGTEENRVPQRLVVAGPYRYVRNPLYDGDFCLILGAALLTRSCALVIVAALDLALLAFQLPFEERDLGERFGAPYRRYCELVPRFVPRRRPVHQRDLHT